MSDSEPIAWGLGELLKRLYGEGAAQDPVAARALSALASEMDKGQVCLDLKKTFGGAWMEARGALLSGAATGAGQDSSPFVADARGRLYLRRFFAYEVLCAERFAALLHMPDRVTGEEAGEILRLCAVPVQDAPGEPNYQAAAVAGILKKPFAVVSGGPGTGKTRTIVGAVSALLTLNPKMKIALCAPTGKAAKRLSQALGAAGCPAENFPREAVTVHRLISAMRGESFDAVVVDECGMVSLKLVADLVRAAGPGTAFYFFGDKDQLSSVEEGAVFAELSKESSYGGQRQDFLSGAGFPRLPASDGSFPLLSENVTWLTKVYRFDMDKGIGLFSRSVLKGDASAALAVLRENTDELRFISAQNDAGLSLKFLEEARGAYEEYAAKAIHTDARPEAPDEENLDALFAMMKRTGVLTVTNDGRMGCSTVNSYVREKLFGPARQDGFYPGEIVMVTQNDYGAGLFNGDIGVVLSDGSGDLSVWFENYSGAGAYRSLHPGRLPEHQEAFAITVHKSQGSEYERVLLAVPSESRILTRELLYTGATRAKKTLSVFATEKALRNAVASLSERSGGILDRLKELEEGSLRPLPGLPGRKLR